MASAATERASTVQTHVRHPFAGRSAVIQSPKHPHYGFQQKQQPPPPQPPHGSSALGKSATLASVTVMDAETVIAIAKPFATSALQSIATDSSAGMPGSSPDFNGSNATGAIKQGRSSSAIATPIRQNKIAAPSSPPAAGSLTSHGPPPKPFKLRPTLAPFAAETSATDADRLNHLQRIVRPLPDTPAPTSNDIFISYRHSDAATMTKLKEVLVKNGFSVWVDESSINVGAAFIGKIGEGIISSKIFMCLVSESTYASRYCTDELCLAYIKEKPIYAVSLKPQADMFAHIPTSIKLLVSRFEWTTASEENFEEHIENHLIQKLRAELESLRSPRLPMGRAVPTLASECADVLTVLPPTPSSAGVQKLPLRKLQSGPRLYRRRSFCQSASADSPAPFSPSAGFWLDFWVKRFFTASCVPWDSFESAFFEEYGELLKEMNDPDEKKWFMDILKRELGAENGQLLRNNYNEFITDDDGAELNIFACVTDLLRENIAMRKVFNLSSTVRINAINDLAKFHSQSVIELLLDMLNDSEQDVRAAACLSLAKVPGGCDLIKIDRLRHCLKDDDRFVRQAACVALGYLKADVAVADLLKIWRNDHIAEVRYEAQNALHAIGGETVQSSIRATSMLCKEIEELSKHLRERSRPQNGYALHKEQFEPDSTARRQRRNY